MKAVLKVPKNVSVFVLEDDDERMVWFYKQFPDLVRAETSASAIATLKEKDFDLVFLDHDLGLLDYQGYSAGGQGTGREVAKYLSGRGYLGKMVVIHSWNPTGAAAMKDLLEGAYAIPFGQFDVEKY